MKSAWMLGAASAVLFSIGGCQGEKPELSDDFSDLAGADEKSDQFSKKMSVVGSLDYGQTSGNVKYHNPPLYRAFKFGGAKGDQVTIDVTSKNGDAYAWLTDNNFKVIAKNDDSNGGTNSHIEAKLPANSNPDIITYYIIFTEYFGDDATFKVALKGTPAAPPDYFSCKSTSDCVAEPQGGCCPHGFKVAVNKNQVTAWETTQQCTANPRPACPLFIVNDPRVASCNATSHQCEMVNPTTCGGIAGLQCAQGDVCLDNPNDSCDPAHGGADCGGLCVTVATATHCGGIAARPCPRGQSCVDDPTDSCDPANGGADCGGLCVGTCIQTVLCTTTSHWDPTACACVANATCVQNVLCVTTAHWDPVACSCVAN